MFRKLLSLFLLLRFRSPLSSSWTHVGQVELGVRGVGAGVGHSEKTDIWFSISLLFFFLCVCWQLFGFGVKKVTFFSFFFPRRQRKLLQRLPSASETKRGETLSRQFLTSTMTLWVLCQVSRWRIAKRKHEAKVEKRRRNDYSINAPIETETKKNSPRPLHQPPPPTPPPTEPRRSCSSPMASPCSTTTGVSKSVREESRVGDGGKKKKGGNKDTERERKKPVFAHLKMKNIKTQTFLSGGLGYSQIGRVADGIHPGPSLMRKQVVEFLHAVTYLRGERERVFLSFFFFFFDDENLSLTFFFLCSPSSPPVPLVAVNIVVILVKLVFG